MNLKCIFKTFSNSLRKNPFWRSFIKMLKLSITMWIFSGNSVFYPFFNNWISCIIYQDCVQRYEELETKIWKRCIDCRKLISRKLFEIHYVKLFYKYENIHSINHIDRFLIWTLFQNWFWLFSKSSVSLSNVCITQNNNNLKVFEVVRWLTLTGVVFIYVRHPYCQYNRHHSLLLHMFK